MDTNGVNDLEVIKKNEFFQVGLQRHGLAIVIYKKEK